MYDHNQFEIPDSFVALFLSPGQTRPAASREAIAQRYDLCEDLAHHLGDYARGQWQDLGVTEHDVLQRCHEGLCGPDSVVGAKEAVWIVRRLAELQGWPWEPTWLSI